MLFPAALGVPDDTPFVLLDACPRGHYAEELMRPRHLLLPGVEDHEIANEVQQPRLVAHLGQRPVDQRSRIRHCASGRLVLPVHEELLRCARCSVTKPLRVAAGEEELGRAEERLVEDLFLIRDELPDPIADLHRASFQLDHADGKAVEIEHDVRPPFVAPLQRHLFGQREVVLLRVLPVNEVHRLVGLTRSDLYRHAVAQELVGAEVRLVERGAGRIGGGLELLEGSGNVGVGIAAGLEVVAQKRRLDCTVVLPLAPVAEVAVAEAVGLCRIGEQGDDAVLRRALGARLLRHGPPPAGPASSCR